MWGYGKWFSTTFRSAISGKRSWKRQERWVYFERVFSKINFLFQRLFQVSTTTLFKLSKTTLPMRKFMNWSSIILLEKGLGKLPRLWPRKVLMSSLPTTFSFNRRLRRGGISERTLWMGRLWKPLTRLRFYVQVCWIKTANFTLWFSDNSWWSWSEKSKLLWCCYWMFRLK